jgi:SAM-dependent methyltransferase
MNPDDYEAVSCNLCGADDADVLLEPIERPPQGLEYAASGDAPLHDRLVRCRRCELVYVSPRPKQASIEQAYAEVDNTTYLDQGNERIATFRRAARWLIDRGVPMGRLLDVGCAGGFFIRAAKDAGWAAQGIEISKHLCEFARNQLGVEVIQGTIQTVKFPGHFFDVISFWDVLEHVADPADALNWTRQLLKLDGALVINYPDYDSLFAKILGRRWWFLIDVHIYYFTPETLTKLLRKCGFEPQYERRHLQVLRLGYIARRVQGMFPRLGRALTAIFKTTGMERLPFTYYASQKTVIARPVFKPS